MVFYITYRQLSIIYVNYLLRKQQPRQG